MQWTGDNDSHEQLEHKSHHRQHYSWRDGFFGEQQLRYERRTRTILQDHRFLVSEEPYW